MAVSAIGVTAENKLNHSDPRSVFRESQSKSHCSSRPLRTCLESNRKKVRKSRACRPESRNLTGKRLTPRHQAPACLLGKRRFPPKFRDSASALDSKKVLSAAENPSRPASAQINGDPHFTPMNKAKYALNTKDHGILPSVFPLLRLSQVHEIGKENHVRKKAAHSQNGMTPHRMNVFSGSNSTQFLSTRDRKIRAHMYSAGLRLFRR